MTTESSVLQELVEQIKKKKSKAPKIKAPKTKLPKTKLPKTKLPKTKLMKSRFGSDPRNKKKIYIPSKWKVAFKTSENINRKINEKI